MSNPDPDQKNCVPPLESGDKQFIVLDEGNYSFVVTGFVHSRFHGSEKLPPCSKVSLTLTVELQDSRVAVCHDDLFLCHSLEWKLAAFFRAIGPRNPGEHMIMDWARVQGSRGYAHFKPRTYISDGTKHTVNSVERYHDYNPDTATPDWVRETQDDAAAGKIQPMISQQQMDLTEGEIAS